MVLQAIAQGTRYGFEIIEATGLPSGTVYPAPRRPEGAGFLSSEWESKEEGAGRPVRCYYELSVRSAMGASRSHLVRQLLGERLGLAVMGGVAGTVLDFWCEA